MTLTEAELIDIFQSLDNKCWSCGNNIKIPSIKEEDGTCSICEGTGYSLNDIGRLLIKFLNRHKKDLK